MYRIRWERVQVYAHGKDVGMARMCIAERRKRFLWWHIWWPIGDWHHNIEQAEQDVAHHKYLLTPLPKTRTIT